MSNEKEEQRKQLLIQKYEALADVYNKEEYSERYNQKERTKLIGDKLTSLRKSAGLTQKEVSEMIGISPQTYAGYESGRHEPNTELLIRLAFFYDVSMDSITCRYLSIPFINEDGIYIDDVISRCEDKRVKQLEIEVSNINRQLHELNKKMLDSLSQKLSQPKNTPEK